MLAFSQEHLSENWPQLIEAALDRLTPPAEEYPQQLHQAMRYSLFAGGKRYRPLLLLLAAETVKGEFSTKELQSQLLSAPQDSEQELLLRLQERPSLLDQLLIAGASLEMLHTYSLIHDDLPCMDNDDWRRGKPTLHKVEGEAVAILAGDALLTRSLGLLGLLSPPTEYQLGLLLQEMSAVAGSRALIAGQIEDLESEGQSIDLSTIERIHAGKTGALIRWSLRLGAISAGASAQELAGLTQFGSLIGLIYQIIDDILDETQSDQQLGKTAGKDRALQKATFPSLLGLAASEKRAQELTEEAIQLLVPFGKRGKKLEKLGRELLARLY